MSRKQYQRRRRGLAGRCGRIESLESRRLLSININGTASDDTFAISVNENNNQISLTFNGVPQLISPPGDGEVVVRGGAGNDTITLLNTGTLTFFLEGELGDEQYTVGNGRLITDVRRDVFIIDGSGAGNESTFINDVFGTGTSYIIDDSSVTVLSLSAPFIVLPSSVDAGDGVTLQGSGGNDAVRFNSMPQHMVVNLAGGNDTVELGGSQRIVDPNLPANSIIDGGSSGSDVLTIDDSNAASPRSSMRFDDNGLVGGPALRNFQSATITTHQLAGGAAEPVTFRGFTCPFPLLTIVGSGGNDVVEFGEPANPITSRNYWFNVVLDLKTGANLVDVNLTAPTSQWAFHQGGLAIGAGPVGMSAVGIITFTLRTTAGEDLFDVFDTPDLWNIFIDGRGGNDQLRMGTSTDLDNSFDSSIFYFIGGSGDDTVTLSDVGDELGDNDDFTIGATVGFVGDFPISHGSVEKQNLAGGGAANLLAYHSVDKLVLQLDNDPNRVFYDLSGLTTVEIFGNGGSDSFINRAVGTSLPDSFSTSLAQFVTFHGGAGTDNLSLVDNDGGPGSYEINSGQFFYIPTITTSTVNFESFSTVEIIGSDGANGVTVRARPSGATLNIASGEGDDTFTIGGGDLDSNGFFNSGITLSAGTGNDSIVFDDHLDRDAVGETENYTFGNLSLAKGALILVYSTFENQTLLAADGVNVGQINTVPSVNLNAISGFLDSTTIVGGPARGCTVNVGNGNLVNLSGIVNVNLSGDSSDRITVSDQLSTGTTSSYEVNNSQVRKTSTGQTINYSGVTQIVLNTRDSVSVSDAINVRSVPAGTAVIVNANAGNDHLFLGGGNLGAFILGPVTFNGATGIDDVNFSNSLDAIPSTHTLTSTTFTDGIIHTYTGMDLLRFDAGPGGSILNVNSLATAAEITGGSGDDAINVGNGSLANGLGSNMTIAGGGGNDSLFLLGQNDGGTNTYAFPAFNQFRFGDTSTGKIITFSDIEQATLRSGIGGDTIDVATASIPLSIISGAGNDAVTVSASTAVVTVDTGPEQSVPLGFRGGDILSVGFVSTFPASVVVEQTDTVLGLTVIAASTLRLANGAVLNRVAPFIDFGLSLSGTIDLGDGALLWRASGSTPDFRAFLTRGRNNGSWNGTNASINSSLAAASTVSDGVGYGLGSEVAINSIGPFAIQPGDMLLRYTLDGDADLDQQVNLNDFNRLASNFGAAGAVWARGDFDYDGAVNLADFNALAGNFGQSLGTTTTGHGPGSGGAARDEDVGLRLQELA